jgi:glyoxylase-like metal-dependent hydrolase (beta-lactamase superfamily II)
MGPKASRALGLVFAMLAGVTISGRQATGGTDVKVLPIRENMFMLVGAGANITVQVEPSKLVEPHEGSFNDLRGILVVDTGTAEMSEKVLAAISKLSPGRIQYVINTHVHADHVGGNETLATSNTVDASGGEGGSGRKGAAILAHQNVLARMSARGAPQEKTPDAWPTDAYETTKVLRFNFEAIELRHQPTAHTDGDSIVFFRRSDVISTGDVFNTDRFPMIDVERGGSIEGVIDALNNILDIAVFGDKVEDGTLIVPGHGRLCDYADVNEYRNTITIVRDRIKDLIAKGMTLDQAKAARPTKEYDRRYSTPFWTSDMFVEAVYRDLAKKR